MGFKEYGVFMSVLNNSVYNVMFGVFCIENIIVIILGVCIT